MSVIKLPDRESRLEFAIEHAPKMISPVYVYEIDSGDDRTIRITIDKSYTYSPEFEAFDGELLAILDPDGGVEYC